MKKVIFLILFVASAFYSNAQAVKPEKIVVISDTAINADTVIVSFTAVKSKIKSFQLSINKVNGTVDGTVFLQGTINGNDWITIDSLAATNVAITTKMFAINATSYYSYRAYYITTGTQKSILTAAYLRRQDE